MKHLTLTLLVALLAVAASAGKDKKAKDPVVMTVAGMKVTASEFDYFYNKNQDDLAEEKSFDEYVDLFINYKLKVAEALSRGIDTTAAYRDELAGYRMQIAEPYVYQTERWTDTLVNEVIARRRIEVHAAHILLACPEDAPDSLVAVVAARIDSIKALVDGGQPFDALARSLSEDPSARQNAGDLGYFSTMQMVYPFETAAFTTPVGETTVCRSRFGFHLVKVIDRRASRGEVLAAHIMKAFPRPFTPQGQMAARHAIDSLYALLQGGADFAMLAELNSDDQYTARLGGAFPWLGATSGIPEEWLDAAFALKDSGDYCAPIRTQYGWHIIRLLGKRAEAPVDEDLVANIRAGMARDEARTAAMRRLAAADWRQRCSLGAAMSDDDVFAWVDAHLENVDTDFKYLYKEYHDGILLFDVAGGEVWDKAAQDSTGLHDFFLRHRVKYDWEQPRFRGAFIECADDSALVARLRDIYEHNDYKTAADLVRTTVLTDTVLTPDVKHPRFHIVNGLYAPGDNPRVDSERLGIAVPVRTKSEMPVQMTYGTVLPYGPEDEDDVRSLVVADYQDELEQEWVARLRQKFTWKLNQKELDKLKNKK